MKLVYFTQVLENYGDSNSPYWKCKGGSEYIVRLKDGNYKVNTSLIKEITKKSIFFLILMK